MMVISIMVYAASVSPWVKTNDTPPVKRGASGTCSGTPTRRRVHVGIRILRAGEPDFAGQTPCRRAARRGWGGLSPKPKLPQKPRQPKGVQDPGADSVRQATYNVELAAWEAAKLEYEKKMQKRQSKQTAAWKAARKGVAENNALPRPCSPHPHSAQLTALGGSRHRHTSRLFLWCSQFRGL